MLIVLLQLNQYKKKLQNSLNIQFVNGQMHLKYNFDIVIHCASQPSAPKF